MKNLSRILLLALSFALPSCNTNIYKDASSKSSESALIEESIKQLDKKEYDKAIEILTTQLSVDKQAEPSVIRLTAEAYAGKCGLDAVEYLNNIQNNTNSAFFSIFYQPTLGVAVQPAECATATSKRIQIGDLSSRSQSDNIFLTILSMFRLGANIQAAVDTIPANGDGVLDTSVCAMTDSQVNQVILSFGFLIENFAAVSSGLVGSGTLASINEIVTTINSVCVPLGLQCLVTNENDITDNHRNLFRDLLNTKEYGVGSVVTNGNAIAIGLACP